MNGGQSQTRLAMNRFFLEVQNKALRQVQIATGDREEALDIIQHAMYKLASRYSEKADVWPQLFQRILQNAIRDWYRRQKIRRLLFWQIPAPGGSVESEEIENLNATDHSARPCDSPEAHLLAAQQLKHIESALHQLPPRQQQVFLLRAWWGHSVEETAYAMGCSAGSVKTHYSRALTKLQHLLEEFQ